MSDTLISLRDALRDFAAERDWEQFHTPRNLAVALTVEAGELLEHFQWMDEAASAQLSADKRVQIGEEMADVLLYLLRLSDKLQVDLADAAWRKLQINALKYPADKVRGSSRKYTEY